MKLLRGSIMATFPSTILDQIQHEAAHAKIAAATEPISRTTMYDMFFRTTERVVALDMPLNAKLIRATRFQAATDNFYEIMYTLVGLYGPLPELSADEMVAEMSKVRAFKASDYNVYTSDDT